MPARSTRSPAPPSARGRASSPAGRCSAPTSRSRLGRPPRSASSWPSSRTAPASGAGSAVGLGVVLAFLAGGGFEGGAALGEETNEPRRQIPRAIRNAVIGAGIFYVLCMLAQTWGFGTDKSGVAAFVASSSPLGDL